MNHPIPFSRSVLSLSLAALLSVSGSAWSVTVSTIGTAGTPGIDGNIGNPGTSGTNGGAAGDAIAEAIADDLINSARTSSISGAKGGRGGAGAASGGNGGKGGNGGRGGNAIATAETATPNIVLTGDATATANALARVGGTGGRGGNVLGIGTPGNHGDGGDGGDAKASASVVATGNVNVTATSTAGDGNNGIGNNAISGNTFIKPGVAGNATLGIVYGESTGGGNVQVLGGASGGDGGGIVNRFIGITNGINMSNGSNGSNVTLNNSVDGNTLGALSLTQTATGGSAGRVTGGGNGAAGIARSVLSKITSSGSLSLATFAVGGSGNSRDNASGTAPQGAFGQAISVGTNDAGSVDITARGLGGQGGVGFNGANGGGGGSAVAAALGKTTEAGQRILIASQATGGNGGDVFDGIGSVAGNGGSAAGTAVGSAVGITTVEVGRGRIFSRGVLAQGGTGGNVVTGTGSGGNGGGAFAVFRGNRGDASSGAETDVSLFRLSIEAKGGRGGTANGIGEKGGAGGSAAGSASLATTVIGNNRVEKGTFALDVVQTGGDGGTGFVGSDGGDGANSVMKDVFSLSTASQLDLDQTAIGGAGGRSEGGIAGVAGNASSSLTLIGRFGKINITANGGRGGDGTNGSNATFGGSAKAEIQSLANRNAKNLVRAVALGGAGGSVFGSGTAGNGGDAKLGRVFAGSSTGESIGVTGSVQGGDGGSATGSGNAGNGKSISLINRIDGQTSGKLSLGQVATGGASGDVFNGANGVAGSASSILNKSVNNKAQMIIFSQAFGGDGGNRQSTTGTAANGANALVNVDGINGAGTILINSQGRGGNGGIGIGGANSGNGGDAEIVLSGTGLGVAPVLNEIRPGRVDIRALSFAGNGGSNDQGAAGAGGNATVSAIGIDTFLGQRIVIGEGLIVGQQDSGANVTAAAGGGNGGVVEGTALGAKGGDAQSSGVGISDLDTVVRSFATGGTGSGKQRSGSAQASAEATGTFGIATANAESGADVDRNYAEAKSVTRYGQRRLNFKLMTGRSLAIAGTAKAFPNFVQINDIQATAAYATLFPSASDAAALITGNAKVETAMSDKEALAAGLFATNYSDTGIETIDFFFQNSIDFNIDMDSKINSDLLVGLLGTNVIGDHGFDALRFRVVVEDLEVENKLFNDLASAEIYFNDNALNFGLWGDLISDDNVLDLKILFNLVEGHIGQGFSTNLIVGAGAITNLVVAPSVAAATVVPVPAAVWLFGSGLLGLLTIARRRK